MSFGWREVVLNSKRGFRRRKREKLQRKSHGIEGFLAFLCYFYWGGFK